MLAPDHHIALDAEWSVWKWVCLRAPGFSATLVDNLRAPETAAAAALLSRALERAEHARTSAIDALLHEPASKAVNRAIKALKRGEVPALGELPLGDIATRALDAVRRADEERQHTSADAEAIANREAVDVARFILELVDEPAFREALVWQNRVAVHGSIESLQRRPAEAMDSKTREHRRLVANYIQRYCVKNDTIGFFGPVGWARLSNAAEPLSIAAGTSLLAARHVYFEHWAIAALAEQLAADPELQPYLVPRRIPSLFIADRILHHPNGKQIELPEHFAALLHAIDGKRSALAIATSLVAAEVGFETIADAFEALADLEQRKLCTWTLEVPTETFQPEHYLRALLLAAEGPPRDRAITALDELEARRDDVARAAGDPAALDQALADLEARFTELTAVSATRKGGETYAGRMLVFEDCRRDLDVELGDEITARLAAPLALVLASARWYTHAIATRYEHAIRVEYEQLRRTHGDEVSYLRFQDKLPELFPGPRAGHGIAHDVATELHARWETLLAIGDGSARTITRSSRELASAVAAAFRAPGPGWPSARHHSPDILIAAASPEAIRRGDYQLILGEVHVGFNTIMPCLLKEHVDPEILVRAREHDLPSPGVQPVWSKELNRADFYSLSRHDIEIERGEARSARPRDQVVATGELVLVEIDGRLFVRTRDDRYRFPIIPFIERHLIAESFAGFNLLVSREHRPRVLIDDLVVQRESWALAASAIGFADEPTDLARLVSARRFQDKLGMPRRVYVKTDTEAKPFFVDFESPILLDLLARNIKRATRVGFSEMLPTPEQCWLHSGSQVYCSELRMIAVDARAWRHE